MAPLQLHLHTEYRGTCTAWHLHAGAYAHPRSERL